MCDNSGKKKPELSELACGLHRILRSHGNGERTNAGGDSVRDLVELRIEHQHLCFNIC
jgi:hypothetical protein